MFSSNEALENTKQQRYTYDTFCISRLITNYIRSSYISKYYIY